MNVNFECTYCGKKWDENCSSKFEIDMKKCPTCGDSALKVKDAVQGKIDYYQGAPAFPVKPFWET